MPYVSGYGQEIVPLDEEAGYDEYMSDTGYENLVGDEIDEVLEALEGDLVGARRKVPRARHTLRKIRPSQFRRYPLGLGVTALLAGATAVITVTPQLPFKLMRLSTPSANITIDNIQIGTVSQFVAAGGVPSECMAPLAIGAELKGDTCVPGVQIQITVTDVSAAPNTFRAALWGLVAQS
jgi:hypothetical protein